MTNTDFTPTATGTGLLDFLEWAITKGYLKQSTGRAMRTAAREVLAATEGEPGWETVDLDSIDVADTLQRFETLRAMKFSTGSLATYQGRFRKAMEMFSSFRESPTSWRPDIKVRNRTEAGIAPSPAPATSSPTGAPASSPSAEPALVHTAHKRAMITYPFPLRPDVLASVDLPADLTSREADRLVAFIKSLAMDLPADGSE